MSDERERRRLQQVEADDSIVALVLVLVLVIVTVVVVVVVVVVVTVVVLVIAVAGGVLGQKLVVRAVVVVVIRFGMGKLQRDRAVAGVAHDDAGPAAHHQGQAEQRPEYGHPGPTRPNVQ